MVFTTAAFIRRNTPELRKKLEELGYVKNSPIWTDNCSIIWAYQYPEKGFDTPNYVIADSFDIPFDKHSRLCGKFIDCGTNEELFLAIAALRDDTNYMQWFVCTSDYKEFDGKEWKVGDFDLNTCLDDFNNILPNWRKATVNELIQHFKEKEENK